MPYGCDLCHRVNHRSDCPNRDERRHTSALRICEHVSKSNRTCGNKAVNGSTVCHVHTEGVKSPTKLERTTLFHILFLYAYRMYMQDATPWLNMAKISFCNLVTVQHVRAHVVRMLRYINRQHRSQDSASMLDIFNLDTFPAACQNRLLLVINGVQYRFGDRQLFRMDDFPFPQTFLYLQAFDGYTFCPQTRTMRPTGKPFLSDLQVIAQKAMKPKCK